MSPFLIILYFSVTLSPLISDILKIVVFVGMSTDRSFVRSPSTTSRSFYRWTRRYWTNVSVTVSVVCKKKKNCFVLTSLSDLSQEFWASDLSRVREFLMGYMRRGPQSEPVLQLDEVTKHKHTNEQKNSNKEVFLPSCLIVWLYFPSSWPSCSPKRILYATLDFHLLFLMTWKDLCPSTGSPLHTTRMSHNHSQFSSVLKYQSGAEHWKRFC